MTKSAVSVIKAMKRYLRKQQELKARKSENPHATTKASRQLNRVEKKLMTLNAAQAQTYYGLFSKIEQEHLAKSKKVLPKPEPQDTSFEEMVPCSNVHAKHKWYCNMPKGHGVHGLPHVAMAGTKVIGAWNEISEVSANPGKNVYCKHPGPTIYSNTKPKEPYTPICTLPKEHRGTLHAIWDTPKSYEKGSPNFAWETDGDTYIFASHLHAPEKMGSSWKDWFGINDEEAKSNKSHKGKRFRPMPRRYTMRIHGADVTMVRETGDEIVAIQVTRTYTINSKGTIKVDGRTPDGKIIAEALHSDDLLKSTR